jgi:hypothetical protein
MLKSRRRQEKTIVGLEMDPSHLAAAQVEVNGKLSVTKGAVADLRPGIVRDGEVADPVALTEELRKLFADNELPTEVRLGVANQRIVVRTLDVAPLDDPKALEELVLAYSVRGAPLAIAPEDLPVFTVGLDPPDEEAAKAVVGNAWKTLDGITAMDALDRVSEAVHDSLRDGPLAQRLVEVVARKRLLAATPPAKTTRVTPWAIAA